MVAVSPKHDRSCEGSFLLTPSKYRRTTSSASVSESFGCVVPGMGDVVTESSVDAMNVVAERADWEVIGVEKADTKVLVFATAIARHRNAGIRGFRREIITNKRFLLTIISLQFSFGKMLVKKRPFQNKLLCLIRKQQ
jgi:hypothetical protein